MAKPKQMVPKDDALKMDAPQEQPEQQDLVSEEAPAEAAPKQKKSKAKKYRALVNMHLPHGETLVKGQEIELSKAGHAHIEKHFPESKHLIIEE